MIKKEKNFLPMLKKLRLTFSVVLISFFNILNSHADLQIPNNSILPAEVIKIQLVGLMNNDQIFEDSGIEQTWNFAHPNNKIFTGPFERFKEMIKGDSYKMLLNHNSHEIKEIFRDERLAVYEVVILDKDKNYFKFRWQVEKYLKNGSLKNCWLTTMVSQPIPISEAA